MINRLFRRENLKSLQNRCNLNVHNYFDNYIFYIVIVFDDDIFFWIFQTQSTIRFLSLDIRCFVECRKFELFFNQNFDTCKYDELFSNQRFEFINRFHLFNVFYCKHDLTTIFRKRFMFVIICFEMHVRNCRT